MAGSILPLASLSTSLLTPLLLLLLTLSPIPTTAQKTLIPTTAFASASTFATYFGYNYPWGTTHNGAARMTQSQCSFPGANTLTETAHYSPGQPSATFSGKPLTISYLSCTVHAKQTFTIEPKGGLDFSASFIAPTVKGTWPAFWLTAVAGWPPEIDIAEWKGNGDISFNTFNTSSQVSAVNVPYAPAGNYHTVRAELRDTGDGSGDVKTVFYLDGKVRSTQWARGYVGKAMYLVIDLQMEGSSGSPGPKGDTTFSIRDVEVTSYNP